VHMHMGQSVSAAEGDQLAQDKSVRALLRTYKESRPLVLVIDDRYALFPFSLSSKEVGYAVLGFYTIAHAWGTHFLHMSLRFSLIYSAEYQPALNDRGRVVRYKFAFRWCEGQVCCIPYSPSCELQGALQGRPWWIQDARTDTRKRRLHLYSSINLQVE
jgi:hypothetical protein